MKFLVRNIFTTIISIVLLFTGALIPLRAQEVQDQNEYEELAEEDSPVDIQDSRALRAQFVQNTQNPRSKITEFEMILTAGVTSDRVLVQWQISGVSVFENQQEL